jgi:glutamine amidotransferase
MCRLIAIIDPKTKEFTEEVLRQFGALAETGAIPPGTPKGHKDGWGIAAYKNGTVTLLEKNPSDASEDEKYQVAVTKVAESDASLILGHLRKASRGDVSMENTQPYRLGSYVFCHNGTVRDFEKIILEQKYLSHRKGATDSEVVFLYLLQTIEAKGDFIAGFLEGVRKLRTMDYSALNILISDGNILIALREGNENDAATRDNNLCDSYYTLFQGKNAKGAVRYICSQSLNIPDVAWMEIPNHAALTVRLDTDGAELIEV